jgi:hypothetical protein
MCWYIINIHYSGASSHPKTRKQLRINTCPQTVSFRGTAPTIFYLWRHFNTLAYHQFQFTKKKHHQRMFYTSQTINSSPGTFARAVKSMITRVNVCSDSRGERFELPLWIVSSSTIITQQLLHSEHVFECIVLDVSKILHYSKFQVFHGSGRWQQRCDKYQML